MPLDLEIVGVVRDLAPDEAEVTNAPVSIKRLRDSHHAVARLLAHGLTPFQASLQTGYAVSRISVLQRDPAFRELMAAYRAEAGATKMEFEYQMQLLGGDIIQELHERLHDAPDSYSIENLHDVGKMVIDRAGFAPVARSINRSVSYQIGEKMDAARRRVGTPTPPDDE